MRSVHQTKEERSTVFQSQLLCTTRVSIILLILEGGTINEESTDYRGNRFCRESSG